MKRMFFTKILVVSLAVVMLASVNVFAAPGDNVAKGKNVEVSSQISDTEAGAFAVDGDLGKKWCTNPTPPHYITIDLGGEYTIDKYLIVHANAATQPEGAHLNTKAWEFFVSLDGTNWTSVDKVTDNKDDKTERTINPVKAKFVKVQVDNPNQDQDAHVRIYEIEVYEAAAAVEAVEETAEAPADTNPKTGDAGIVLYVGLALVSAIAAGKSFEKR